MQSFFKFKFLHLHLLINEQDYAAAKNLSKNFIIISYSSKFGLSEKFARKKLEMESKILRKLVLSQNVDLTFL